MVEAGIRSPVEAVSDPTIEYVPGMCDFTSSCFAPEASSVAVTPLYQLVPELPEKYTAVENAGYVTDTKTLLWPGAGALNPPESFAFINNDDTWFAPAESGLGRNE